MAEAMNKERKGLMMSDMVMVPAPESVTGWKYIRRSQLDAKRVESIRKLPGLKGHLKVKQPELILSGDDPNSMFPNTSNELLQTGGRFKNKTSGL